MSLLPDVQDQFGGPRQVRVPDFLVDELVADVDASGFRLMHERGEPVNLIDYALPDVLLDQKTAIDTAIAAAAGRTLKVPKGVYWIGASLEAFPSHTWIDAEPGAVFKAMPGNTSPVLIGGAFAADDITIEGLTFDGNAAEITASLILLQFYQVTRLTFRHCFFRDHAGLVLNLSTDMVDFILEGCRFENTGNPDELVSAARTVTMALTELVPGNSHGIKILNNFFQNVGLECVSMVGVHDATVMGNTYRDGYAGFLYSAAGGNRDWKIGWNHCEGTLDGGNAIDLVDLIGGAIIGNTCPRNGGAGIGIFGGCQDITCADNVCKNNGQSPGTLYDAGIVIRNNAGTNARITIGNNICTDDQDLADTPGPKTQAYGILYQVTPDLKMDGSNVLTGNAVAECGIINNDLVVTATHSGPLENQTFTVVTTTTTLSFVIPAGFKNLRIYFSGRLSGTVNVLFLRFNGDTGANYRCLETINTAGTITGVDSGAVSAIPLAALAGSDSAANYDGGAECVIPNYSGATFYKRALGKSAFLGPVNHVSEMIAGSWANVATISSISLVAGAGNFVAGSTVSIVME